MIDTRYSVQSRQDDTLSLSSLDVISCGLGAAVLLGVIFAVVKHESPVTTSSPQFILVELSAVGQDPVQPLLNVVVQPPHFAYAFDILLEDFDLERGVPKPNAQRLRPELPIDNFRLLGFSRDGTAERNETALPNHNAAARAIYRLLIHEPYAGNWGFAARYQGPRNSSRLSAEQVASKVDITLEAITRDSSGALKPMREQLSLDNSRSPFVILPVAPGSQ
jgi:hypothetical protein